MWLILTSCTPMEYQHTPVSPESTEEGTTALERAETAACGGAVLSGLDPCQSGEVLHVSIAGDEIAGRYDLTGDACILAAGCDADWSALWVVSADEPCTWPDEAQPLPYRLQADLDYAVCLTASPSWPGDSAACWLDTSAGSYPLVVENPVDNG